MLASFPVGPIKPFNLASNENDIIHAMPRVAARHNKYYYNYCDATRRIASLAVSMQLYNFY